MERRDTVSAVDRINSPILALKTQHVSSITRIDDDDDRGVIGTRFPIREKDPVSCILCVWSSPRWHLFCVEWKEETRFGLRIAWTGPISPLNHPFGGALIHMEALLQHVSYAWHFWMERRDTVSAANCINSPISPLNHPFGEPFYIGAMMSQAVYIIRGDKIHRVKASI